MLKWILIVNVLFKVIWVTATVVLVIHGHPGWAFFTFLGAVFGGFGYEETRDGQKKEPAKTVEPGHACDFSKTTRP